MRLALLAAVSVLPYAAMYTLWPTSRLFLPDDAYYYFEIARNMADGFGSTFDRINPTNGYHPLWALTLAALASVFRSSAGLIVAALVTQAIVVGAGIGILLTFTAARRQDGPTLLPTSTLLLGLMWNPYVAKSLMCGMESGLATTLAVILVVRFARHVTQSTALPLRSALELGGWASLLILARLDSVVIVASVGITWVVAEGLQGVLGRRRVPRMLVAASIPATTLLVYMALNQYWFGLPMPVSGYLKRTLFRAGPDPSAVALFLVISTTILAFARFAWGRRPTRGDALDPVRVAFAALTLDTLLFFADSCLYRGRPIPEIWYLGPQVVWAVLGGLLALSRPPGERWWRATVPVLLFAGAAAAWGMRLDPLSYSVYQADRDVGIWISENLPEDAVIAGWDSGILGYYTKQRLVNLDGLVNSKEYADALGKRDATGLLARWGVQYIAQYYRGGVEAVHTPAFGASRLADHVGPAVFSVDVAFAGWDSAFEGAGREAKHYPYEVRPYFAEARPHE